MGQHLSQLFQLVTEIQDGQPCPLEEPERDDAEAASVNGLADMEQSCSEEDLLSASVGEASEGLFDTGGPSQGAPDEVAAAFNVGGDQIASTCQSPAVVENSCPCASDNLGARMHTGALQPPTSQPVPCSSQSVLGKALCSASYESSGASPPRKRLMPLHDSDTESPKHPRIQVCPKTWPPSTSLKTVSLRAVNKYSNNCTLTQCICGDNERSSCEVLGSGDIISACGAGDTSFIDILPPHLLLQIFEFLPLPDLLLRASLVCKRWYDLAHDPDLWRVIALKGYMKVSDDALIHLTSLSDNVSELDISDSRFITDEGFVRALAQCKQLQSLLLINCQHLSEVAFQAIGHICHQLVKLRLECCFGLTDTALTQIANGCPRLEVLRLDHCCRVSDIGLKAVATCCPELRYLSLDQCTKVTDQCLVDIVAGCPKLHTFSGMSCSFTDEKLAVLAGLKELRILELANIRALNGTGVKNIVKSCRKLESLNISLCRQIDDPCVDYIARNAPLIHSLFLVSCNLTDKSLVSLSIHCKHLRKLDVGWCPSITDEGVLLMSETCRTLVYFGLMRCDQVTIQTTEMLVSRYPQITYSTMWLDCKRLLEQAQKEGHLSNISIPTLMNAGQAPS